MRLARELAERLGAAIDHIEGCLGEEVRLETAARRAGFSPWHFIRVFQAACGVTPIEYIRRRRLARAAAALAKGQEVLRVALDWGYGSQATFTRAFSREFGVPPGAFRRRAQQGEPLLRLLPRFEPRVPWVGRPPPAPRHVASDASHWVGVGLRRSNRRYSSFGDFPAFWADWLEHERWRAVQGIVPEHRGHALVRPHADGDIEYVIAVEVRPGTQAPRGYRTIEIPATLYAVFEASGEPVSTIQSLALGIYSRLSREVQGRRRLGGWDIERYDVDLAARPGHLRCGLWIPVVRALPGGKVRTST